MAKMSTTEWPLGKSSRFPAVCCFYEIGVECYKIGTFADIKLTPWEDFIIKLRMHEVFVPQISITVIDRVTEKFSIYDRMVVNWKFSTRLTANLYLQGVNRKSQLKLKFFIFLRWEQHLNLEGLKVCYLYTCDSWILLEASQHVPRDAKSFNYV